MNIRLECDILDKRKKEGVPVSNYVKLFLLIIGTMILSLILSKIYIDNINYESKIPIIRKSINSEIKPDEVYNYVRENQDTVIYMCTSNNKECRKLEEEFSKYIEKNKLKDKITYLNLTDYKKDKFIKEFNKFYGTNLLGYPSLIVFKEGEVSDIITTNSKLEIDDVIKLFERNDITNDYD